MIQGNKISLRTVKSADLDSLFEQLSLLENRGEYYPLSLTAEAQFKQTYQQTGFWDDNHGRMLILDKQQNIIGGIWYFKIVPYSDALELGYIIFDSANRNKGYMTEALQLFCGYLFDTKRLNRIQLGISVGHETSSRVAEKVGFTHEGVLRQFYMLRGRDIDVNIYSLLRDEIK